MSRWTHCVALAVCLTTSSVYSEEQAEEPKNKAEAVFTSHKLIDVEKQLAEATNAQREKHGLEPLEVDFKLMSTARRHTAWMANRFNFSHGRYAVAENIALGQNTVTEAIRAWMNSSVHRANILNRGHRKMGVAAYLSDNGQIYWTQQFTN